MGFNKQRWGLSLAASIASFIGAPSLDIVGSLTGPAPRSEPRKKHKSARISVAENKRRSKKKKNIKRARRLGHHRGSGRRSW